MEYNSNRPELVMSEYGRHVQNLIKYALEITDLKKRQNYIEQLVHLISQMFPYQRTHEDFEDRLWRHIFRIGGPNLNVIPPEGIKIPAEDEVESLNPMPYPQRNPEFKHYGNNVMTMIKKALAMEEGPIKDGYLEAIGSYMKLAYRTWNKEHYVSDDIIKSDLKILSDGKLSLAEDHEIENLVNNISTGRRSSSGGGKRRSSGNRGQHKGRRSNGRYKNRR